MTYYKRIALAEDDEDDQFVLKEVISDINPGLELITFNNGEELIDDIRTHNSKKFDLFILDINMPKINGLECIERIRNSNVYKNSTCIVLTTSIDKAVENIALKTGANKLFTKPNNMEGYKSIVIQILDFKTPN